MADTKSTTDTNNPNNNPNPSTRKWFWIALIAMMLGLTLGILTSGCDKPGLTKEDLKGLTTKESIDKVATQEDLSKLSTKVATKGDIQTLATNFGLGLVEALKPLATKDDLKPLATKADLLTLCNQQTKDATPIAQPDPPKPVTPKASTSTNKSTRRATKPKQVAPTATNPALAQRVSNLETRMQRQEHLTKPLSDYADRYGKEYHARLKARLDALDKVDPEKVADKVQAGSK